MTEFEKQLQIWDEEEEYRNIITAIEALPEQEQTPGLISDLARAYNYLAEQGERKFFRKAANLLLSVEEQCSGEHNWNFRLGFAWLHLNQERKALANFEKALEYLPGDEDTEYLIDMCIRRLALPVGITYFQERTRLGWEAFMAGEEELRRMMDEKMPGDKILAYCGSMLEAAFENVRFELGYNGSKYDCVLTPEGDRAELFKLIYFKDRAPAEIKKNWNFLTGRQPSRGFLLRMNEQEISAGDVVVWPELLEEDGRVGLTLFCEKLLPVLQENENMVYSMMTILLDQVIGELAAIRYIEYLELAHSPIEGESYLLEALPEYLTSQSCLAGWNAIGTADQLTDKYTAYQHEPSGEEDWCLREDVIAGSSCCMQLLQEYYRGEEDTCDMFQQDGVVAGFFYYPLAGCERDKILDFRDWLEQQISLKAGADAVTFIGGAAGTEYGYLDFIGWDFQKVLDSAVEVFEESDLTEAYYHSFRRDVKGIILKKETIHN